MKLMPTQKSQFIKKLLDHSSPVIIAEIGQNHDGSLGMAHSYIDALADAGVDAIKFQTHIASEESTFDESFRIKFSYQDETRYDYWKRMEFTEPQWAELKDHADIRGIEFLSTPFSNSSVEMLDRIGINAWKIGSGDTRSNQMIDLIISTNKPIILSSGMSNWIELDEIISKLSKTGLDYYVMQCTSKYPTPLEEVGLNLLEDLKNRYGCRVGLSDHSGLTAPAIGAISRGFSLIEVHATFDKRMFGPDIKASLTIEEIESLVKFARNLKIMDSNPVDKDSMALLLKDQKELFSRSLALVHDLSAGHILTESDLVLKKPGGGLQWSDRDKLIDRPLARDVSCNRLLKTEDVI
jgi:N,N'-diacetyllegionaminate synthase